MTKKISGTREWAVENVNCVTGCEHGCIYCYARSNAIRFKLISGKEEWEHPKVRQHDVEKKRKKIDGRVMFPTTHDITPGVLQPCIQVLRNLLEAGNQVLVVSKPHLECVKEICQEFEEYKDKILFRFTIGAFDDSILEHWEPNAPNFLERFSSLQHAYTEGFQTSVSVEPMLDAENVIELFQMLESFVTDAIWIGKMNQIKRRVEAVTEADKFYVERILNGQIDERITNIYQILKDEPKVKWKESIKKIVGLDLAEKAGLDE